MHSGRIAASALLVLSVAVAACDSSSDPFAPDPSKLKGRGSASVDDLMCDIRLSRVDITLASASVPVGGSVDVSARLIDWHGDVLPYAIDWYTGKSNVAVVENGKVLGKSVGTTDVFAQCGSKRSGKTITVTDGGTTNTGDQTGDTTTTTTTPTPTPPPGNVSVSLSASTTTVGQSVQATASIVDATGHGSTASVSGWSSSNSSVATVNSNGLVSAVGAGTTTISAVVAGVTGSADLTVSSIAVPPTPPPVVNVPGGSGVTASAPELPRANVPDAAFVSPSGRVIRVSSGGDLQGAINSAQPGDQVLLAAGSQFFGNFELRPKGTGETCSAWVTITSETSLPAPGTRVTPSSAASFAKIISPNQDASIKTVGRGSCYRVVGVELTINGFTGLNYGLVMLGDDAMTSLGEIPHGIVLDRVYLHGQPGTNTVRCIALNSARSAIINSWVADCHARGFDSQAIEGWNGPGPYLIENNFLSAAGENVMFGGADPSVAGLSPSDITIRRNHIWKDPSWKGVWVVKNLIELKHAKRVLIDGNVMENNWADGQSGMAIVLKTLSDNARAPWTQTADVTIRYNIVRNSPRGFNLQGMDGYVGTPVARVRLEHNLFEQIGPYNGTESGGWLNLITHTPSDVAILHNTMINNSAKGLALMMDYGNRGASRIQVDNNVFTNPTGYGIFYSGMPVGNAALTAMAGSSWSYSRNVMLGIASDLVWMHPDASFYPGSTGAAGMSSDYRLTSSSPYKGKATDGTDPGADLDELARRTSGVVVR